jgi:hypothetical protein
MEKTFRKDPFSCQARCVLGRGLMIPIFATFAADVASNVVNAWTQKRASTSPAPAKTAARASFDAVLQQQPSSQPAVSTAPMTAHDVETLRMSLVQSPEMQIVTDCFGKLSKVELSPAGDLSITDQFGRSQTLTLSSQTQALARQLSSVTALHRSTRHGKGC